MRKQLFISPPYLPSPPSHWGTIIAYKKKLQPYTQIETNILQSHPSHNKLCRSSDLVPLSHSSGTQQGSHPFQVFQHINSQNLTQNFYLK